MSPVGTGLVVLAALRIEALAIGGRTHHVGMGPAKAQTSGSRLARDLPTGSPIAVLGVSGGLDPALAPGQAVVAETVRAADSDDVTALPQAHLVAEALERCGVDAPLVDLVSTRKVTRGAERARLAESGVRVVDMESAWLAHELAPSHPLAVVRVVGDGVRAAYVIGGIKGLAALHHIRPAVESWAETLA